MSLSLEVVILRALIVTQFNIKSFRKFQSYAQAILMIQIFNYPIPDNCSFSDKFSGVQASFFLTTCFYKTSSTAERYEQ